jgi:hypothetical protein
VCLSKVLAQDRADELDVPALSNVRPGDTEVDAIDPHALSNDRVRAESNEDVNTLCCWAGVCRDCVLMTLCSIDVHVPVFMCETEVFTCESDSSPSDSVAC